MPNFMHLLAQHNNKHGITATHSELKKTARRMAKAYESRPDKTIDPYAYVLDYQDPVGEEAADNVDTERETNHHNAARRLAAA